MHGFHGYQSRYRGSSQNWRLLCQKKSEGTLLWLWVINIQELVSFFLPGLEEVLNCLCAFEIECSKSLGRQSTLWGAFLYILLHVFLIFFPYLILFCLRYLILVVLCSRAVLAVDSNPTFHTLSGLPWVTEVRKTRRSWEHPLAAELVPACLLVKWDLVLD